MILYTVCSPVLLLLRDESNEGAAIDGIVNKHMNLGYDVSRVIRSGDYAMVAAYASMTSDKIVDLLKSNGIAMEEATLTVPDNMAKYLPSYNRVCNGYMKGGIADSPELDAGIKPLVEVMNKFPGIRTFASCDGHGDRFMDVLWNTDCLVSQEILLRSFDFAFNDTATRLNFPVKDFKVEYLCGVNGVSRQNPGIYFELRIQYNPAVISFADAKNFVEQSCELLNLFLTTPDR